MSGRAKWKNPFKKKINNNIIKKKFLPIERNYEITPNIVGKIFKIYNGKIFLKLTITNEMIGHKIGEFVPTRVKFIFKKKRKAKKK